MVKWKHVAAVLALFVIGFGSSLPARSGQQTVKTYTLFNGAVQRDTVSEQPSQWIPIRGANRVVLRTFTIQTTTATTDTAFVDSITTWKTLFADSISFTVRDSAGVLVPARNFQSSNPLHPTFPWTAADSTVITGDGADSTKFVVVEHAPPTLTALNFASTKGGFYTVILPISAADIVAQPLNSRFSPSDDMNTFMVSYMRIRVNPTHRVTNGWTTAQNGNIFGTIAAPTSAGLHGLKVVAYVYSFNAP